MKYFLLVILTALNVLSLRAWSAETVDIPAEELARESVLPKFDKPDNVRNRNVVLDKKMEFGMYFGGNFTEPIYAQSKIGFNLGYHLSEDAAVMFNFAKWMSGRNTQYVPQIESKGSLDFDRIPNLQYSLWGNYEITSYYGKISMTKQGVMNVAMYPIVGLGVTKYDNKVYPGVDGGIGQKYYFTKALALRIDFKLQYQQGPNPFLGGGKLVKGSATPSGGDFEDKWMLGTILDLGLSYLF